MKILVFSLGVVFQNKVQGGSQKVLRDIMVELGKKGYEVVILCPKHKDSSEIFKLSEQVIVKPILMLGETFPMPYAVSPYALTETCIIIEQHLENSDLFYCHDGGLNIEFLKNKIPTVVSLRDFCYPETLLGALNFNQHALIVNSDHTFNCLVDSFKRVNSNIKDNIHIVYNGYDGEHFKYKTPTEEFLLNSKLEPKDNKIIIGFPHRPDIEKGFEYALQIIESLSKKFENIRLLIPRYMDEGISNRTDSTFDFLFDSIHKRKLENFVVFHSWIDHAMMPEYYSYCDLILCVGGFVESFSNVAIESLLCETPVIAANVATYRTMPIKKYLEIVPYGDIDGFVDTATRLIQNTDVQKLSFARNYIIDNLSLERSVVRYDEIFKDAVKNKINIESAEKKIIQNKYYKLTSWCSYIGDKIYDDYAKMYHEENLNGLFKNDVVLFEEDLLKNGINKERIETSVRLGIILPLENN